VKRPSPGLAEYCRLVVEAPLSVTSLASVTAIERELVDDSLAAMPMIGPVLPQPVVDVGSGNGSPGIPLALTYGAPVTLVESVGRKAVFLEATARALAVDAEVVAERSELYARGVGRDRFSLALARALAQPPVAAELCLPLVRPGGRVVLWTGAVDAISLEAVARHLAAELSRVVPYGGGRNLVELTKIGATPDRFPRRPGMAGKRPLAPLPSSR
jgi:16S rRNA (guanine527-N7)-methyltransferase